MSEIVVSRAWFFLARALARRWRALVARAPSAAVVIGLTAALAATAMWVSAGFGDMLRGIDEANRLHRPNRTGAEAKRLFDRMVADGRLTFDKDARLTPRVDCPAWNAGFPAPSDSNAPVDTQDVLALFCQSDLGAALRSEIDAWNGTVALAAVRDDWDGLSSCQDGAKPESYVPAGCHPSKWSAAAAIGRMESARRVRRDVPAPGLFGFLAEQEHPGFGDWSRFDAAGVRPGEGVMVLVRGFDPPRGAPGRATAERRTITIDVVGDVVAATWRNERDEDVAPVEASPQMLCELGETDAECRAALAAPDGPTMPRANRFVFEVPVATRNRIAITIKPISVVEKRVRDLSRESRVKFRLRNLDERPRRAGELAADGAAVETLKFTAHMEAQCDPKSKPLTEYRYDDEKSGLDISDPQDREGDSQAEKTCALFWDDSERQRELDLAAASPGARVRDPPPEYVVFARKGEEAEPLSQTHPIKAPDEETPEGSIGIANAETARLGLVPVVGFDAHDPGGLLGALRRVAMPGQKVEAPLTIDDELQAHANVLLKDLLQKRGARPDLAEVETHLPAEFDSRRRAAIVLIDGGAADSGFDDGAGRILAAASYPQIDKPLSEWDLLALDASPVRRDPIAARGWARSDRFNAAGSTFKPIIALAAIDRAAREGDDSPVAAMLGAEPDRHDGLDAAGMTRVLGADYGFRWDATELSVPVFAGRPHPGPDAKLHNDQRDLEPVSAAAARNGRGAVTVALRRALATSNNLWFARLALAVDSASLSAPGANGKPVEILDHARDGDLAITRVIDRIWPAESRDLMSGLKPQLGYVGRLHADRIVIDETNADAPRLLKLALSGFGEGGVQATPLALASVMATIATGRIVEPRLTEDVDPDVKLRGAPLFDPAPVGNRALDGARAATMLETLRGGLADVVNQPGGTAFEAFRSNRALASRVSGKTGTATVGGRTNDREANYNTVWFVGWIDGLTPPRLAGRRIAFGCMVSHAFRGDHAAGGTVCAPLMRKLFESLEPTQAAAARPNGRR